MTYEVWLPILAFFGKLGALLAQERMYEWHWEMHPMWWWGWGIGMMAMMFLFWVVFIIGLIVAIRWLLGAFWQVYHQLSDDLGAPDESPAYVARKHRDIYTAVVNEDRAAVRKPA